MNNDLLEYITYNTYSKDESYINFINNLNKKSYIAYNKDVIKINLKHNKIKYYNDDIIKIKN